jgi:hypothetical protein
MVKVADFNKWIRWVRFIYHRPPRKKENILTTTLMNSKDLQV